MSLEDKIEALTASIDKNNELLSKMVGIASNTAAAKAGGKAAASTETKASGTKAAASTKKKAISTDDIVKKTGSFLDGAEGDEDEVARRKGIVKKLLGERKAKKVSEITEQEDIDSYDEKIQEAIDAGTPTSEEEEDESLV